MQSIRLGGKDYVIIERAEYDRPRTLAKAEALPALPSIGPDGNYPAVDYARASLARKIIAERAAAGLTQRQLADAAGIRVETVCRLETGKHTPSVETIGKIDRALRDAAKGSTKQPRKRTRKRGAAAGVGRAGTSRPERGRTPDR